MDLDMIRELIRLMKENRLSEIDIESAGEHVRLKAEVPPSYPAVPQAAAAPPAMGFPPIQEPAAAAEAEPGQAKTVLIKSPIVGTYYHAAAPDKPPFVQVGDTVDENTVVCIIEAMKVMNEIKAEMRGIVHEILAKNGQAVEFGQPLIAIEPMP